MGLAGLTLYYLFGMSSLGIVMAPIVVGLFIVILWALSFLFSLPLRRFGIKTSSVLLFFCWLGVAWVWFSWMMTFVNIFIEMNVTLHWPMRLLITWRWPGTISCVAIAIFCLFKNRWTLPRALTPVLYVVPVLLLLTIIVSLLMAPSSMSSIITK